MVREAVIHSLHPMRGLISWSCQKGLLPEGVRKVLPWRWVTEPFTIYGSSWKVRWFPTANDSVGHRLFWSGLRRWEHETAPFILDQIRSAKCFIDIGANSGFYSVAGAVINPDAIIIACEPVPDVFSSLCKNVRENHLHLHVVTLNIALGDTSGVVPFHQADDSTMGSFDTSGYQGQNGEIIEVECRTLDEIVFELGAKPDFMKIDVEGFEHAVLRGASRVLTRFKPAIVLEANPGDACDVVSDILSGHGYTFQLITDHGLEPHPRIEANDKFHNWYCVPSQLNAHRAA